MEDKNITSRDAKLMLDRAFSQIRNNRQDAPESPFIGDTTTLDIRVPEEPAIDMKPVTDEFRSPEFDPKPMHRSMHPPIR